MSSLIGGTGSLDINSFGMHDLKNIVYIEETHETRSYLILAAVSNVIKDVEGIYIPASEYYKDYYYDEYIKNAVYYDEIVENIDLDVAVDNIYNKIMNFYKKCK